MVIMFMLPIVISALIGGLWPGIISTVVATLCFSYLAMPPGGSLLTGSAHDLSQRFMLFLSGVLVSFLSEKLHRDITIHKRTEEALRESEERWRMYLETANEGVFTMDAQTRITYVNQRFADMLGGRPEEIIGTVMADYIFPEDLPDVRKRVENRRGGGRERYERRLRRRDGGEIWTLLSAIPLHAEDGTFQGSFAMFIDITERKRVEEALSRAKEQAEAANRAKSQFLANVSHEIRSPMNAILGLTELALRQNPPQKLHSYLEKVITSSHVLLGVINDLLDFSKIEAGMMELTPGVFDPKALLGRLSDIYAAKAWEKGVRFRVDFQEGIPAALIGDSLRLEQILINLADNAVKFTGHGEVSVAVAWDRTQPGNKVNLRLSVRDTGIGMTKEQLERVFNPFVQAESSMSRRYGGTGLGLSIVSRLVDMMGGKVTMRSDPGVGSTITVSIPFDLAGSEACRPASRPGETPGLEGVRALVVDDNDTNLELMVELLSLAGVDCKGALTGQEALEMLGHEYFDVALMDVQMPGMDGYELAQAIRNQPSGKGILLLALTAHAMSGDKERCLAAGMDDYLTKPVMPETLFAMLRKKLSRDSPGVLHDKFP